MEDIKQPPETGDVLVNFSTSPTYINEPYDPDHDVDLKIAEWLRNTSGHFITMGTRTVYGLGDGRTIDETAPPNPSFNYAKNKLETERRIQHILGNRCTIFRLSNIFGMEYERRTFAGHAMTSLKNNGKILLDIRRDVFRDFLPVQVYAKMLCNFVASPVGGIFNLGSGQKTTVGDMANWFVGGYGSGTVEITNNRNFDSFCLDVSKVGKIIDMRVTKQQIEQYAKQAGRELRDA